MYTLASSLLIIVMSLYGCVSLLGTPAMKHVQGLLVSINHECEACYSYISGWLFNSLRECGYQAYDVAKANDRAAFERLPAERKAELTIFARGSCDGLYVWYTGRDRERNKGRDDVIYCMGGTVDGAIKVRLATGRLIFDEVFSGHVRVNWRTPPQTLDGRELGGWVAQQQTRTWIGNYYPREDRTDSTRVAIKFSGFYDKLSTLYGYACGKDW
jgi:hypothetical protein